MTNIVAVSTGLSEDSTTTRLTEQMLDAVSAALRARGLDSASTHFNVRTLARSLADLTVTGTPSQELEEAYDAVRRADAVITVAPVYKQVPVGIHTLFWQLIDDASLAGTPVMLGATGGTPRHSLALETLRPMIGYLKGITVPTAIFAATDDWGNAEASRDLRRRIGAAAEELADLTQMVSPPAAKQRDELDPEQVTPFADLLGR